MAAIRIIAVPPGDAPEEVRRAWVGLVVPVDARQGAGPRSQRGVRAGRTVMVEGFALDAPLCIELLATHHPVAAAWWRDNTPHLLEPGRRLIFPTDVCELVDTGDQALEDRIGTPPQPPSPKMMDALNEWFDVDSADLRDAIVPGTVAVLLGTVVGAVAGAAYMFFAEGAHHDDVALALVVGAVCGAIIGLVAFTQHNVT